MDKSSSGRINSIAGSLGERFFHFIPAIPSPPASLGNFELGAGSVLVAFGGDTGHAAAFAIGLHAIQLLPAMVMGGVMLNTFRKPAAAVPPAGAQEA